MEEILEKNGKNYNEGNAKIKRMQNKQNDKKAHENSVLCENPRERVMRRASEGTQYTNQSQTGAAREARPPSLSNSLGKATRLSRGRISLSTAAQAEAEGTQRAALRTR